MKKAYVSPAFEQEMFETDDVITVSFVFIPAAMTDPEANGRPVVEGSDLFPDMP